MALASGYSIHQQYYPHSNLLPYAFPIKSIHVQLWKLSKLVHLQFLSYS